MGSREDAEEITQDVLLSLWRHHKSVQPEKLSAWVMRVTRNACIDAVKKRRSYRNRVVSEDQDMPIAETAVSDDDPVQRVEALEFSRQVEQALLHLSEPYRTIVICREIQDMTYDDIAETTGLPLNTVKAYLHRGRKMLRTRLRSRLDDES